MGKKGTAKMERLAGPGWVKVASANASAVVYGALGAPPSAPPLSPMTTLDVYNSAIDRLEAQLEVARALPGWTVALIATISSLCLVCCMCASVLCVLRTSGFQLFDTEVASAEVAAELALELDDEIASQRTADEGNPTERRPKLQNMDD